MEIFAVSIFSLVSASTLGQAQLQPQTPRGRGQPEIAKFNKFNHQTKYIRIDANAIQVVILARSDASQQPPPRSWPLAGWGPHGHPGGGAVEVFQMDGQLGFRPVAWRGRHPPCSSVLLPESRATWAVSPALLRSTEGRRFPFQMCREQLALPIRIRSLNKRPEVFIIGFGRSGGVIWVLKFLADCYLAKCCQAVR